ncbi:MAG TPA: GTP 3',8-cyclase MoaA [Vicinamibacterales bacterium]|nr:GTP 3',8-cyclase MoaA [Vicinamibacterales bacterium]
MLFDALQRPLGNLRLSVTDRCNLRCQYCMPEQDYVWLPREDILQFEEIDRLVDVFLDLDVRKVRLTGGEPLLRKDLPVLIERLAAKARVDDLAMTTNAVLLAPLADSLKRAGLHRLTISLDTLQRDRFIRLARYDELDRVLAGIDVAAPLFPGFKIDTVVIRGVNDDELVAMVEFAKARGAEVRFIEYMDVGGATRWHTDQVMTRADMLTALTAHYGGIAPYGQQAAAPAARYQLEDGTVFGIISSTSQPFCRDCDRSRLTADGMWYLCLYASHGTDLRAPLRAGATPEQLTQMIRDTWSRRTDRGAEARLALRDRAPMIPLSSLKRDPHLEMHTRGG